MFDINFVELVFKNGTDAEKGEILLALEKRDLELFGDVLDLVGKNQSVATEILKYLRKNEENS